MKYGALAAILLMASAARAATREEPPEDEAYKPATRDYGKVNKAWEYKAPIDIEVPAGQKLVAADIELPATTEPFDLDDIDIFDADTGKSYGSDLVAQRLTTDGQPIDDHDPDVDEKGPYRGLFLWVVDARVHRVNFGYWGELLYKNGAALSPTGGAVMPQPSVAVLGVQEADPTARGPRKYRLLLDTENWSRAATPESYALSVARASRTQCAVDTWIETDGQNRPRTTPARERPYYEKNRRFLLLLSCPSGTTPEPLNRPGSKTAPALQDLRLPPETLRALESAERNKPARPRKD
jgi:hypothetical protein